MKCLPCKGHRDTLHTIAARINESKTVTTDCTSVSSHVNYIHLSSSDKKRRLSTMLMYQALRTCQRQVSRLRTHLSEVTAAVGEVMSEDTHESWYRSWLRTRVQFTRTFLPTLLVVSFWLSRRRQQLSQTE